MSAEERLTRLENAFVTLARLAENMDERMDTHLGWINLLGEAQANSGFKIAALADAQIRTEEVLARVEEAQANTNRKLDALADAQIRTEETMAKLAEAQAHTDRRLDALIDIIRDSRNGKS